MNFWEQSKDVDWMKDAECAKPSNRKMRDLFFSDELEDKHKAKNLCFQCPVRKDCVKWALETTKIWGIWGGNDEHEIRRALSVNADGAEIRRDRFPKCPYCQARTSSLKAMVVENPGGGRWLTMRLVQCLECEFTWRSRTSANAVNAYHALKADKKEQLKKITDAAEYTQLAFDFGGLDLEENDPI